MDDRIIKRDSSIEILTVFRDMARQHQGHADDAKRERKHHRRSVVLRQRQELRRKFARGMAVGFDYGRGEGCPEYGEQQQRIFERIAKCFGLLDQHSCPLCRRLRFRRGIPSDMDEWSYERDLKLDFITTQRRCAWQGRDLVEGAGELSYGFDQRRALDRPLSRFTPQKCGLCDQPSFGAVTRQQLGLVLSVSAN